MQTPFRGLLCIWCCSQLVLEQGFHLSNERNPAFGFAVPLFSLFSFHTLRANSSDINHEILLGKNLLKWQPIKVAIARVYIFGKMCGDKWQGGFRQGFHPRVSTGCVTMPLSKEPTSSIIHLCKLRGRKPLSSIMEYYWAEGLGYLIDGDGVDKSCWYWALGEQSQLPATGLGTAHPWPRCPACCLQCCLHAALFWSAGGLGMEMLWPWTCEQLQRWAI